MTFALLFAAVLAVQSVDDPVEEVAAFYLERCSGRTRAAVKRCEAALAENRRRIERERYLASIPSARLGGKHPARIVPAKGDGIAALELEPIVVADRGSDAPSACLSFSNRPLRLEARVGDGPGAAQWQTRVRDLVARKRLTLEMAFAVKGEQKAAGRRCAKASGVLRAVDPDTGQVLAGPASADGLRDRPLHPALLGGLVDPVQAWAQQVRVRIGRGLTMPGRARTGETHVLLRVGSAGEVREATLKQSSGDRAFDETVMRAVAAAGQLPPPPDTARAAIERSGVVLRFRR